MVPEAEEKKKDAKDVLYDMCHNRNIYQPQEILGGYSVSPFVISDNKLIFESQQKSKERSKLTIFDHLINQTAHLKDSKKTDSKDAKKTDSKDAKKTNLKEAKKIMKDRSIWIEIHSGVFHFDPN